MDVPLQKEIVVGEMALFPLVPNPIPTKGQLVSKRLFGVFNFLQKTTNKSIWGFIVVK